MSQLCIHPLSAEVYDLQKNVLLDLSLDLNKFLSFLQPEQPQKKE